MPRTWVSACVLTVVVQCACAGAAAAQDPVIAAAGDIACDHDDSNYNKGAGSPGFCRQRATSDLLVGAGLAAVLPLGDIQYDSAAADRAEPRLRPDLGAGEGHHRPVLGNHEGSGHRTTSTTSTAGRRRRPGRQRGKGWYSYDVGSWHLVALNSNCDRVGCAAGSQQEQWLRADLAAHPTTLHARLLAPPALQLRARRQQRIRAAALAGALRRRAPTSSSRARPRLRALRPADPERHA